MNEEKHQNVKLWRSSDLYFASFLVSLGFPLTTTESAAMANGSKKVIFVFTISDADLMKSKSLYFGGSGTVKARLFVDNLRSLKQMVYC